MKYIGVNSGNRSHLINLEQITSMRYTPESGGLVGDDGMESSTTESTLSINLNETEPQALLDNDGKVLGVVAATRSIVFHGDTATRIWEYCTQNCCGVR